MGVPPPETSYSDDLQEMKPMVLQIQNVSLGSWVRVVACTNHTGLVGRVVGRPRRVVVAGVGGPLAGNCATVQVELLLPEEVAMLVLAQ